VDVGTQNKACFKMFKGTMFFNLLRTVLMQLLSGWATMTGRQFVLYSISLKLYVKQGSLECQLFKSFSLTQ